MKQIVRFRTVYTIEWFPFSHEMTDFGTYKLAVSGNACVEKTRSETQADISKHYVKVYTK